MTGAYRKGSTFQVPLATKGHHQDHKHTYSGMGQRMYHLAANAGGQLDQFCLPKGKMNGMLMSFSGP